MDSPEELTVDPVVENSETPAETPPVNGEAAEAPGEATASTEVPEPEIEDLPILAVRDTVLFPNALLPLTVGRPASVTLVESLGENRLIGVVSQTDPRTDEPKPGELHRTGTVAMIHKVVRLREGQLLFCEGVARMRILEFTGTEPFLRARIERLPEIEPVQGVAAFLAKRKPRWANP